MSKAKAEVERFEPQSDADVRAAAVAACFVNANDAVRNGERVLVRVPAGGLALGTVLRTAHATAHRCELHPASCHECRVARVRRSALLSALSDRRDDCSKSGTLAWQSRVERRA